MDGRTDERKKSPRERQLPMERETERAPDRGRREGKSENARLRSVLASLPAGLLPPLMS